MPLKKSKENIERVNQMMKKKKKEEDYFDEKRSNSSSNSTSNHNRCSRGVSTDEIEENRDVTISNEKKGVISNENRAQNSPSEIVTIDEEHKPNHTLTTNSSVSQSDHYPLLQIAKSSVFLQLIACGSSSRPIKAPPHQISNVGRKSNVNISSSCGDLHKEVLCKSAKNSGNCYNRSDEDDAMINCMSENPRFGNPQSEDKEYFSGSIVEAMAEEGRVLTESTLKKSSSYNQERSAKCGLAEEEEEEKAVRGKCLPRKKFSSKQGKK
ncbi:hypothetical protein Scep_018605 [Stephania cephalantha]|uniref:Uncharacterized protein n=1 Tax=Stephania cephalantha TaxID=152367 RepID=A0AAP0NNZ1_9MAGN